MIYKAPTSIKNQGKMKTSKHLRWTASFKG